MGSLGSLSSRLGGYRLKTVHAQVSFWGVSPLWFLSVQWGWGRDAGLPLQSSEMARRGVLSVQLAKTYIHLFIQWGFSIASPITASEGECLLNWPAPALSLAFLPGSGRGCSSLEISTRLPWRARNASQTCSASANSLVTLDQSYRLSGPQCLHLFKEHKKRLPLAGQGFDLLVRAASL